MNNLSVDTSQVDSLLRQLDHRHLLNTYRKALRKGTSIIARQTKQNLRSRLGRSASHNGRYGRMTKGIKVKIARDKMSAKVHIMGDFRLKFFEKGTNERYLRRNHAYRGKINALNFFSSAVQLKQQEAQDTMIENIRQTILNIRP